MPPKKKVYRSIADSEKILKTIRFLDIHLLVNMMPRNMNPRLLIQILKKLLMLSR